MKKRALKITCYIFLILLAAVCLIPFAIMILNSTQDSVELVKKVMLLPGNSLAENYKNLLDMVPFWKYMFNSLIIAVPSVLVTGYIGTMAAYGFEKYDFKGKNFLYVISMAMMIIPGQVSVIGLYRMFVKVGLTNNYLSLILPSVSNVLTVYWMRAHIYQVIETSLIEAARIDGCSEWATFNRIILPICKPGIMTISIMNFVTSWNDYINPMVFLTDQKKYTLPLGIAYMRNQDYVDQGALYLMIAMSTLIILVFYIIFNSYIVGSVTAGSVKG